MPALDCCTFGTYTSAEKRNKGSSFCYESAFDPLWQRVAYRSTSSPKYEARFESNMDLLRVQSQNSPKFTIFILGQKTKNRIRWDCPCNLDEL